MAKAAPRYEARILKLLAEREEGKTICPSEVLAPSQKGNKAIMAKVREAACRLVDQGKIVITQKGRVVGTDSIRGPIRLRLK